MAASAITLLPEPVGATTTTDASGALQGGQGLLLVGAEGEGEPGDERPQVPVVSVAHASPRGETIRHAVRHAFPAPAARAGGV